MLKYLHGITYNSINNVVILYDNNLPAEDRRLSQQLATVQATVTGIVATTASCIELMQEREHLLHDKISSVSYLGVL